jgi:hypothetical protein
VLSAGPADSLSSDVAGSLLGSTVVVGWSPDAEGVATTAAVLSMPRASPAGRSETRPPSGRVRTKAVSDDRLVTEAEVIVA